MCSSDLFPSHDSAGAIALIGAKRNIGIFETMSNDIGGLRPKLKDFTMLTGSVNKNLSAFKAYAADVRNGINPQIALNQHLKSASYLTRQLATNTVNSAASADTQSAAFKRAEAQIKANTVGYRALSVAMRGVTILGNILSTMAIAAAVTLVITGVSKLINAEKNLAKEVKELTEDYKNQKNSLQTLRDEYQSIINSQDSEADKTKLLDELKQKIIKTYDLEKEAIKGVNNERKKANDLLDDENAKQNIAFVENPDNKKMFEKTKSFYDEQFEKGNKLF